MERGRPRDIGTFAQSDSVSPQPESQSQEQERSRESPEKKNHSFFAKLITGLVGSIRCFMGRAASLEKRMARCRQQFLVRRRWDFARRMICCHEIMSQLKGPIFQVEYKSLPGLDHGGIIGGSMPDVFMYFNQHTRSK